MLARSVKEDLVQAKVDKLQVEDAVIDGQSHWASAMAVQSRYCSVAAMVTTLAVAP